MVDEEVVDLVAVVCCSMGLSFVLISMAAVGIGTLVVVEVAATIAVVVDLVAEGGSNWYSSLTHGCRVSRSLR
jgi:hypothetical protein